VRLDDRTIPLDLKSEIRNYLLNTRPRSKSDSHVRISALRSRGIVRSSNFTIFPGRRIKYETALHDLKWE
jgi:hypothetical protein